MFLAQSQNDIGWLDALKDGDTAMFERLVGEFNRAIYSMCWRYTLDEYEAQDLTQEVFVLIYRNIGKFRSDSELSTWIYRIAVNCIYSNRRRASKRNSSRLDNAETNGANIPSGADEYHRRETSLDIEKAISKLSEKYRNIIELYYFQDLPRTEIASILQLPLRTVETRLYRARSKLKDILVSAGYGEEYLDGQD